MLYVCSLFFCYFIFKYVYHTSQKNIQILVKVNFYNFSDFGRVQTRVSKDDTIISMGILDNLEAYIDLGKLNSESAWDTEFQYESSGLKVYSEICCNGCTCKTSNDHKPEN